MSVDIAMGETLGRVSFHLGEVKATLGVLLDALHDDFDLRLAVADSADLLAVVKSAAVLLGGPYLPYAEDWL